MYLTDEEDTGTESYELDGDTLTLTGEDLDADDALKDLYPLVFNRV